MMDIMPRIMKRNQNVQDVKEIYESKAPVRKPKNILMQNCYNTDDESDGKDG